MESYDGWNPSDLLATNELSSEVQEYEYDLETLLSHTLAQGLGAEGHVSLPSAAEGDDADNDMLRLDHSCSQSPPLVELDANQPGGGQPSGTRDKVSI